MELYNNHSYDFKNVAGIDTTKLFTDSDNDNVFKELKLHQKVSVHKENTYNIVRYDKQKLNPENYNTSGLFRSIIHKDGNIVCFAPPKSMNHTSFQNEVDLTTNLSIEEYVEGTMINVFWSGTEWEIATRSSVGGNVSFFVNNVKKTFRQMFLETVDYNETQSGNDTDKDFFKCIENIPHDTSLTFVMQHPDNRIVVPFTTPKLYLVKAYNISKEFLISEVKLSCVASFLPGWVMYPDKSQYSCDEIEMILKNGTLQLDYMKVGIMIAGIHKNTGKLVRTKIRNPNYEYVRELRGNQPKLPYRYLMLRQEHKVSEYLKYYPEHKDLFKQYREKVHDFTHKLYKQYVSCFVYKQKKLGLYSQQYRTHMYKLHGLFITDKTNKINMSRVVEYVNGLHPSLLLHSLNYEFKSSQMNT